MAIASADSAFLVKCARRQNNEFCTTTDLDTHIVLGTVLQRKRHETWTVELLLASAGGVCVTGQSLRAWPHDDDEKPSASWCPIVINSSGTVAATVVAVEARSD